MLRPDYKSLRERKLPVWFDDAKLGIFIHWGLYSVPAWATPVGELGQVDMSDWFRNNAYAEWYQNSLRIADSPTQQHHAQTYGADVSYESFANEFRANEWNPAEWAALFHKAGAKYVVLTTKHHDGFCLWPTKHHDFHAGHRGPKRDLVGELTSAVRQQGLKMGLYYSGGLDWTYSKRPIEQMVDLIDTQPISYGYADYAYSQVMELVEDYRPDVLWNDISWPDKGQPDLPYLFSNYYYQCPDGVVNDRWNCEWCDFVTQEYSTLPNVVEYKWEATRGLGFSFGYNQIEGPEHTLTSEGLIRLLVDVVSKNGNLLINIGPKADGTISELQRERLESLGEWLSVNGQAIYGTRPWSTPGETSVDGTEIRFTRSKETLYCILLSEPSASKVVIDELSLEPNSSVYLLGDETALEWDTQGTAVEINLPRQQSHAFRVLALRPSQEQLRQVPDRQQSAPCPPRGTFKEFLASLEHKGEGESKGD